MFREATAEHAPSLWKPTRHPEPEENRPELNHRELGLGATIAALLRAGYTMQEIIAMHPEWFSDSIRMINMHDDWQTHTGHDIHESDFYPEE